MSRTPFPTDCADHKKREGTSDPPLLIYCKGTFAGDGIYDAPHKKEMPEGISFYITQFN